MVTNKRHLTCLFNTVLLLLSAFSVYADTRLTLRINDTNEPPLTTPQHDGFLDIIATEAFARAGVKLQLIKLPAERALINANAGIDDGDLTRIAGLERLYPNLIRVPEKLINWEFTAFTKATNIPATWQGMRHHIIGYITGWKIYEQHLHDNTQIVTATNPTQLFYLLSHDRIEVALYARWMGQALIEQLRLKNIHQLEPVLDSREMFIYLNKRHAALVPRIAESLRALKREGVYDRIRREKLTRYTQATPK